MSLCTGSSIPFDAAAIDRQIASSRSPESLAKNVCHVVFDLYDHCALTIRMFAVDDTSTLRQLATKGDKALAAGRGSLRTKVLDSGRTRSASLDKPAGFRVLVTPLHDGAELIGLIECVVPVEMLKAKADHLAFDARAASAVLSALRRADALDVAAARAVATSFALGLRLAGIVARAGEREAATRAIVDLLARELRSPVAAWRLEGEASWLAASVGLTSGRRSKLEPTLDVAPTDRATRLRSLRDRAIEAVGPQVTVVDASSVVLAAGGRHPELELCGRELGSLLSQLPATAEGASLAVGSEFLRINEVERLNNLTAREREILALLATGATTSEIADRLVISNKTVKTHVQNILRKLGVGSRLEAAALAVRAGYVSVSA